MHNLRLHDQDIPKLLSSLSCVARRMSRGDHALADDLVAEGMLRIIQVRDHKYTIKQFHVVGVNAMLRAIVREKRSQRAVDFNEYEHGKTNDGLRSVEARDLLLTVVERLEHRSELLVLQDFIVHQDTLTESARRCGLSAATASRAGHQIRKIASELVQKATGS